MCYRILNWRLKKKQPQIYISNEAVKTKESELIFFIQLVRGTT